MRRVTDPQGEPWLVDVDWTGRRTWRFVERRRARKQARRESRATRSERVTKEPTKDRWGWLEWADPLGDFDVLLALLAAAAALAAVIFLGPWILAFLLDGLELLILPILGAVIIAWRVLRRQPFEVRAEHGGEVARRWHVVGLRSARRLERAIADAIVAGGDALLLFPESAVTAVGPSAPSPDQPR